MNNTTIIKVRGYHLDVYGHVNNARYLEFLEEGRWAMFDGQIEKWSSMGVSFFVVNININYRAPALLNTTLEIHSKITKYGTRSCVLNQTVIDSETKKIIVDADITFVIADQSGKSIRIQGNVLENLKQFGDEA